jgi:hypothetical protein
MMLVTGSNERYQHRIKGYLATLQQHADFPCYHVGVGYMPGNDYGVVMPVTITREQNAGSPPQTECVQHGSFLAALPAESDVIMYTDGDFTMQRPLNDTEWELLDLPHDTVAVGYNGGEGETLLTEYHRLSPKVDINRMNELWGNWQELPIFNVGCVAMTRNTWERLHSMYMDSWDIVGDCFDHAARQQWLISWLISEYFGVRIIPWLFHAHGHFGLKPGMEVRGNEVYVDGQLALFRHYI